MPQPTPSPASAQALRFSRRLSFFLVAGVIAAIGATLSAAAWMARGYDDLAERGMVQMVQGGLATYEERLVVSILDYSIWTAAHDALVAGDAEWAADNIGTGAETNAAELIVVLEPGGGPGYGWRTGSDLAAASELLEPEVIVAANAALDPIPIESAEAAVIYARSGGVLWLLTAARTVPFEGVPEGATDADLPRMIFGRTISSRVLAAIGRKYLIDDLLLSETVPPGHDALPFTAADGTTIGYASWSPPKPGRTILTQAIGPLLVLLALVSAIAVIVARTLVRSARELENALLRAQAADQHKTEFLANVSHELRTPLSGVIGMAQLLQMRELNPEAQDMLRVLMAAANAQLGLVNQLLDISRIESGAMGLEAAPFDPAACVDEVVLLFEHEARAKRLALSFDGARGVTVVGDALAFKQIATNLIGNAVKFTKSGAVRIVLAGQDAGSDRRLTLTVADNGPGIAPADHARVFERFFQVDSSLTRNTGGTGLGLTIARSLAELMGGSLTLDSVPGAGATLTLQVTLPRAETGPLARAA